MRYSMWPPRAYGRRAAALLLGIVLCTGCEPPPVSRAAATGPVVAGPRETLHRLIRLRAERKYRDLQQLVVPARGARVIQFLMAVDEFLTANRQLCNWIRDQVGLGLSQTIDQSYVVDDLSIYAGDGLGIFSRSVELLDAAAGADEVAVSYTIADHLPAKQVRLRRSDGQWRFDPGPDLSDQLPAAFRELATALGLIRQQLERGTISRDELRDNPERLIELIKARLRRGVSLLSKARADRAQGAAP